MINSLMKDKKESSQHGSSRDGCNSLMTNLFKEIATRDAREGRRKEQVLEEVIILNIQISWRTDPIVANFEALRPNLITAMSDN